jgi:protein-S-isoprenylcysteine O-methyltransferase Ste14
LALLLLGEVIAVAWLLLGGGITSVSEALGLTPDVGSPVRRGLLLGAAAVYFFRVLATLFVFVKRRVGWAEVATLAVWIGLLQFLFAFFGGRQTAALGVAEYAGVLLYVVGSFLNSGSEYQRDVWKRVPQHKGKLYSAGLFRYAVHINFFGDVVLFTGWALLTGCWPLFVLPTIILLSFVFMHIPTLDRYLAEHYGDDFRAYSARTAKLIPFLY